MCVRVQSQSVTARGRLVTLSFASIVALLSVLPALAADDAASADEETLKSAGVGSDAPALVAFLHKHVLADKEREAIESLIRQLGDERFAVREEASDKLVMTGVPAVSFLRAALRDANTEIVRRAGQCLHEISGATDPAVLAAAVRSLARSKPPETLAVLLEFFPFAGEEWVEEDVLLALGELGVRGGKPDPLLQAALKDPLPARRAAAVHVLARWGTVEQRPAIRQMLADPEFTVRAHAARGLLGERALRLDVALSDEDRKLLRTSAGSSDVAAVLTFLRRRTLSDDDRRQMEEVVQQLDSNSFTIRQDAAKKLVDYGTPALPFLRAALKDNSLEMTRRVENCIKDIEKGPGPVLPMVAARLLTRRHPPEAVQVLLDYVPFADDAAVEEEVANCLATLAAQSPRLPEALGAAVQDELPARRRVAALVLGLVGEKEHCGQARLLLVDSDASVRLRAAQGLLKAKDRAAVPALLALLGDAPVPVAAQAEELLREVGGDRAPLLSIADGGDEGRKKAAEAWNAWWRDQGDQIDLTVLAQGTSYLGVTMVAELTSNNGTGGNRVYEFGSDGKPRWEIKDLQFPIDARWLRGGHVLIAEYNAQRVIERDRGGKVVWEKKVNGNPVSCQRLTNGNTLIATYTHVLEVTPTGREVFNIAVNMLVGGQQMYNAIKLRNGTIACITGGTLLIIDANGKRLKSFTLANNNFNWAGVEELPGGKFLVALMGTGKVLEIDAEGKPLWEASVQSCCHAVRLPNGNTLVACMQQQKVVEINRSGKVVWEKTTSGRPFHVRRR
jgi:HEAT repeat protein